MPDDAPASRRSQRSREAILQATVDCCQEASYDRLSIEGVARRAKVGKQTIYRWWPSKAAVVLEALNEIVGQATDFPHSDNVRDDLRQQMTAVVGLMTDSQLTPLFTGLIAAAQCDPEVAQAVRDELLKPRFDACVRRLEQARADGQLRADANLVHVVELLYGPLYYRVLLWATPVTIDQVNAIIDYAFDGLEPAGAEKAGTDRDLA